jgi:large subunit ribosomal protein L13
MKETSYERMLERRPGEILRKAVYGMMPKTRLARQQMRKLKIYAGPEHPHAAQNPQKLEVE